MIQKRWHQKKRYWVGGILLLVVLAAADGGTSQPTVQNLNQNGQYAPLPYLKDSVPQTTPSQPATQNSAGLSNDNYYTNVSGNKVHSPTYSETIPIGASAKCRDGTYSFSQNRRGTCSHHGGVARWL